jgi:hypothetical protein
MKKMEETIRMRGLAMGIDPKFLDEMVRTEERTVKIFLPHCFWHLVSGWANDKASFSGGEEADPISDLFSEILFGEIRKDVSSVISEFERGGGNE